MPAPKITRFMSNGQIIKSKSKKRLPVAYGHIEKEGELRVIMYGYELQLWALQGLLEQGLIEDTTPVYDKDVNLLGAAAVLKANHDVILNVVCCLKQDREYTFLLERTGETKSMTPRAFLMSRKAHETIVVIEEVNGSDITSVWCNVNGWDEEAYSQLVNEFLSLISKKLVATSEFIDTALNDELNVTQAVNSYLLDETPFVQIHRNMYGYIDLNIDNHRVSRATPPSNVKRGDVVNGYLGSEKIGMIWKHDLLSTLDRHQWLLSH